MNWLDKIIDKRTAWISSRLISLEDENIKLAKRVKDLEEEVSVLGTFIRESNRKINGELIEQFALFQIKLREESSSLEARFKKDFIVLESSLKEDIEKSNKSLTRLFDSRMESGSKTVITDLLKKIAKLEGHNGQ